MSPNDELYQDFEPKNACTYCNVFKIEPSTWSLSGPALNKRAVAFASKRISLDQIAVVMVYFVFFGWKQMFNLLMNILLLVGIYRPRQPAYMFPSDNTSYYYAKTSTKESIFDLSSSFCELKNNRLDTLSLWGFQI